MDNLDEIVMVVTKTGKIDYANKKAIEMSGYSREEFVGSLIVKYLPSRSKKIAIEALTKEFLGVTHAGLELEVKVKLGEIKILYITVNVARIYEGDKMAGILINAHDITREKEAKERLRELEEKYRSVIESANDIIIMFDNKSKTIDLNNNY